MKFTGFSRATLYTPVPEPVLGSLLEEIESLTELKCTLRALWLLHRKKEPPRCISMSELSSDRVLIVGLKEPGLSRQETLRRAMEQAAERGTFIRLVAEKDGNAQELYFLNDEAGRRAVSNMDSSVAVIPDAMSGPSDVEPEPRPNIFGLYEENIGMLTPLLADQMKEAERVYPWPWIEETFRLAVSSNKRSWRFIESTLKRWEMKGKGDGESGRYPEKTPSKEDLVEYLRRRGRLPGS